MSPSFSANRLRQGGGFIDDPSFILGSALLLTVVFGTFVLFDCVWISRLESDWADYRRESRQAVRQLERIRAAWGYDGFAHRFENWVLRRERRHYDKAGESLRELYAAIDGYAQLRVGAGESAELAQLRAVVDEYAADYGLSGLAENRLLAPAQLDRLLHAQNRNPQAAIDRLQAHVDRQAADWDGKISRDADYLHNLAVVSSGFLPIFLFGGASLAKSRRRSIRIAEPRQEEADIRRFDESLERRAAERAAELVAANAALRAGEARLQSILDHAHTVIFLKDLEGRYLLANRRYLKLFGLAQDSVLGKTDRDLFPEEVAERLRFNDLAAIGSGAPMEFEEAVADSPGSPPRVYICVKFPLRDESGRIYAVGGIATDITERKLAEQAMRLSEERLRIFIEHAPAAIAMLDGDMRYLAASRRWMTDYALGERDIVGQSHYTVFPEIPERWKAIHRRALAGEVIRSEEDGFLRLSGETQWLRWEVRPWYGSDGAPAGIVVFSEDITERKAAERNLRLSEERLWLALSATGTALWDWNVKTGEVYWSPEHYALMGYAPNEVEPSYANWAARLHPDDREAAETEIQASMRERREYRREFRVVWPDGGVRWLEARASYFYGDDGCERMLGAMYDIGARKRAEHALQESKDRLQLGMDVAGLALAEIDYATGIARLSAEAARLFGLGDRPLSVSRETLHDSFHPDDRKRLLEQIAACTDLDGPGWFAMEHRVVHADGRVRWLRARKQVFFENHGAERRPVRAMLAALDLTAEKSAAEAAARSEAFVRGVLDSLPQQVVVLDEKGEVISVNEPWRRFARDHGVDEDAVSKGVNYLEICRRAAAEGDDYARRTLDDLEALLEGRSDRCELEYPCHEPSRERWFLLQARRFLYDSTGLILSHIDITERKQAEEALRNQEERIRTVLENVVDAIVTIDSEGTICSFNPAAERIFGYRTNEALGRNIAMLMRPETAAEHDGYLRRYLETGEARILGIGREVSVRRKDGQSLPCDLAVSEFFMGGERYFIGILRDIAERKAMLAALAQAKEEAERANRAKSLFLANMSHEIRTPMNAIMGMTTLCLASGPSELQRNYLTKIGGASEALLHIVDDILDFSKIEAGKLNMVSEPFVLSAVCESLVSLLSGKADEKRLTLTFDIAFNSEEALLGDAHRLNQVLINLLGNAIKFSSQGEVRLQVRELRRETGQVLLEFAVSDQGVGISAETQTRLFQPFSQADASASRSFGGTGLGLAISKRLVEMMGGEIGVESEPDKGSVFRFTGRFALAAADAQVRRRSDAKVDEAALARLRGAEILVVEDAVLNQEVMVDWLRRAGFRTRLAVNGAEALQEVARARPDAVLMDCQMPVMDGYEAAKRLREAGYRDLPIVALTANAMAGDRERCLACGMNAFVAKPIDFAQLSSVLVRWTKPPARALSPSLPTAAPERTETGPLPELPGIDVAQGLAQASGRMPFYCKLLRQFRGECAPQLLNDLERARRAENWSELGRSAHSLKGAALTLGAIELGMQAGRLESAALAADAAEIDLSLESTRRQAERVLAGLAVLPETHAASTHSSRGSEEDWLRLCEELAQLLDDRDTAAVEVATVLEQAMSGSEHRAKIAAVAHAVSRYAFDEARKRLDPLISQISADRATP